MLNNCKIYIVLGNLEKIAWTDDGQLLAVSTQKGEMNVIKNAWFYIIFYIIILWVISYAYR